MTPMDCPRFEKCSAPVCPLDGDWRLRAHNGGDRICAFLPESVKSTARETVPATLFEYCKAMSKDAALPGIVKRALERAPLNGSRLLQNRLKLAIARERAEENDRYLTRSV